MRNACRLSVLSLIICLVVTPLRAADVNTDATWTGEVKVTELVAVKAALTIAPGTKVIFSDTGSITVMANGVLVAKGTAEKSVLFLGDQAGIIQCNQGAIQLEHCQFDKVGVGSRPRLVLKGTPGKDGITLSDCQMTGSGGLSITPAGPFRMSGCDMRDCPSGLAVAGAGPVYVTGNTFLECDVSVGQATAGTLSENIIILGHLSSKRGTGDFVMEYNYVHDDFTKARHGMGGQGIIRNNVIRGGSWTAGSIGGEITGNVFESLPSAHLKGPSARDKEGTHEHLCGLLPDAKVVRNIFVGESYGAIMGIGPDTGTNALIRNNTINMLGRGQCIILNHLPKNNPVNIIIRNNVFMRCGAVEDERGIPDCISYVDYNLWAAAGQKLRFTPKVTLTGKQPGDAGFGGHDLPPYAQRDKSFAPKDVVVDPDFTFAYSDEDMLARKHTVKECLELYRKAYALKPGSPAINAGDPADAKDPEVTDGKPDVGAIEFKP